MSLGQILLKVALRPVVDSPRGRTPPWWWGSPGWRATPGGSWAVCPPSSGSCPAAEGLLSGWTPAAGSACPCPWRRTSGSGTERPWAPRRGTSSSPPRRRFGSTRLGEKGEEISLSDWERREVSEKSKEEEEEELEEWGGGGAAHLVCSPSALSWHWGRSGPRRRTSSTESSPSSQPEGPVHTQTPASAQTPPPLLPS